MSQLEEKATGPIRLGVEAIPGFLIQGDSSAGESAAVGIFVDSGESCIKRFE